MSEKSCLYNLRRKCQALACNLTSPEFISKIYFKIVLGYTLNLKNPKSFNEKLQWLKLNYWPNNKKAIICADKYRVREYIKSIGEEHLLNDIFYAWDKVDDIDWEKLPERYVLKCNHGCGYNLFCRDKATFDIEDAKSKLKQWMSEDFGKFNAEPHYDNIPKKIICEKLLDGEVINYNIYCFNGKPVFFSLAGGLGDGIGEHLTYYNVDGTKAIFKNRMYPVHNNKISPKLKEMVSIAEKVSKDFPMVRVDLYDINGKIILSEMTFTPGGALIPLEPIECDFKLGEMLDIKDL